jgi:tetratricopeptide (TPR) repeat protein
VDAVSTRFDLRVNRDPNNIDLRLQRGEEYLRLQAYPEALADFGQAKLLAATRPEPYLGLGRAYYYLRQWNEAEAQFSSAVTFNEEMPEPHFWLGQIYYYQGKNEDAAKELNQAAELNPQYAEAEAQLALVYVRMDDLKEAEAAAGRAVRVNDKLALAYLARGIVRAAQQDLEGGQTDLLYAQKLAPYDFTVLNGIARFYCDYRPERLVEAERLAQQAVRWAKDDIQKAQAYHTLGRIYLALDRKEDAKAAISEAASLGVVDGTVVFPELQDDVNKVYGP